MGLGQGHAGNPLNERVDAGAQGNTLSLLLFKILELRLLVTTKNTARDIEKAASMGCSKPAAATGIRIML